MILVYECINKNQKKYDVLIDHPNENIENQKDILSAKLSIWKSFKEIISPSKLNDNDIMELMKIQKKVAKSTLTLDDLPGLLENSSKPKIKALAEVFRRGFVAGENPVDVIASLGLPRYIEKTIISAQKSGNVEKTYQNIIEMIQLKISTSKKINKIMRYPKMVGFFILGFFFINIFYTIPSTKENLFKTLNITELPPLSEILYGLSDQALENPIWFVIKVLLLSFITYKALYYIVSKIILIFPKIRQINEYRDISLFFSLMSSLSEAGVYQSEAIRYSSEVIGNDKKRELMMHISDLLDKEGGNFADYLDEINYDKKVISEIRNGDKTGSLVEAYNEIKDEYGEDMVERIEFALEFINPITLILIVSVIITLYYGINAPMINIGTDSI